MGGYFEEARPGRLLDEYPIGEAFLAGPARMSRDELRALQERRFRQVVARGWEVPFYARRWRAAGLEPGDVRSLDDVGKLPPFSKRDLMESVAEFPPLGDFHGMDRPPGGASRRGARTPALEDSRGMGRPSAAAARPGVHAPGADDSRGTDGDRPEVEARRPFRRAGADDSRGADGGPPPGKAAFRQDARIPGRSGPRGRGGLPEAEHGAGGGLRHATVLHTTSGTTGAPQPVFYGAWDREVQNALLARAYRLHGLRDDDVVHSVYGFGMVNGGHYVREALLHFTGALVLAAGTGLETPSVAQVDLMRRFGATVLVGFSDYLRRLADVAREQGGEPSVRLISGHVGRGERAALSEAWGGAEVFDWYGVADTGCIAAEGPARDGLHVFEDAHYVELLKENGSGSGAGGQAAAGTPGSLCTTALFKHTVYPVIRFDTNDLTRMLPPDPASGIGFRRITGFEGRADAMVKVRGINVYPHAVGAHLAGHPASAGEYVCRLRRRAGRDELSVVAEVRAGVAPTADLARELGGYLRARLGVAVEVELAAPGETAALTGVERRQKPVRLIDERARPPPRGGG